MKLTIANGKIAFSGLVDGVTMRFTKINNKYLVETTTNSSTGNRIKNNTKLVFMINNTQCLISTAKNANIQCIAQTCISIDEFTFSKIDFTNMVKATKLSFKIYYANGSNTQLAFDSKQILALRNFVTEIK